MQYRPIFVKKTLRIHIHTHTYTHRDPIRKVYTTTLVVIFCGVCDFYFHVYL